MATCSSCSCSLLDSNDGLDTYDEGYAILPDGCYRSSDLVCVSCYESTYSTCDGCEAHLPADELTDGYCAGCEPEYRVRWRVKHVSYCGTVSTDDADDEKEARGIVAEYARAVRRIGGHVVRTATGWELSESDDAAMVPTICGTVRMYTYRRADLRR